MVNAMLNEFLKEHRTVQEQGSDNYAAAERFRGGYCKTAEEN